MCSLAVRNNTKRSLARSPVTQRPRTLISTFPLWASKTKSVFLIIFLIYCQRAWIVLYIKENISKRYKTTRSRSFLQQSRASLIKPKAVNSNFLHDNFNVKMQSRNSYPSKYTATNLSIIIVFVNLEKTSIKSRTVSWFKQTIKANKNYTAATKHLKPQALPRNPVKQ